MNAAGVGITLTASSNVGFIEFPWTDAICVQCEDRCHRIGSKDNVTASYFLGSNTYDVRSYEIIQNKRDLAVKITGTDEQIEETQISFALDYFKNKL